MNKQRFYYPNKAIHSIILLGFVFSSFGAGSISDAPIQREASVVPNLIDDQALYSELPSSARTKALPGKPDGFAQAVLPSSFCDPDGADIGAYVAADPPTAAAVQGFENLIGRHVCSVTWYQGWNASDQPAFPNLDGLLYHDGYDTYTIPQLTWEPWVKLSDISAGKYDTYLTGYANQMKAWRRTIRLRFAHEMIQDDVYCWGKPGCQEWYPWQDQPVAYVAAFRHVHDVFRTAGAGNVEFVWCPNNYPFLMSTVQKYYPGDAYVDWLCMDGYNPGNQDNKPGQWPDWQWFDDIFHNLYHTLADNKPFYGDKPIMIGETTSCEASPYDLSGQTKSAWITNTFQRLKSPDYAQIKSLYWFNINKECDWRVNSSPQSLSAFQTAISDPYFGSHPHLLISGNTGMPNATLSYTDSTLKATASQIDGSYTLAVSNNWSGTVTPSHPCFIFSPAGRNYSNVMANQISQNYASIFTNAPVCAVTTGVFRPGNGLLYLKNSNISGFADIAINYGVGGDYPVVGDWDGNGTTTIGIYRNGSFYLRNSNTKGIADWVFAFGTPGDQPVAGDWNGDGTDTIGVYHSANGTFSLRNSNDAGPAEMTFVLGNPGDVGIAGDWTGKGFDTTGVFRPSNGALYLKNQNSRGIADIQINYGLGCSQPVTSNKYFLECDQPVTGDWNNDGIDTIGVYRHGTFYLRNSNTKGIADFSFGLGNPGDMPIAGNWDGQP